MERTMSKRVHKLTLDQPARYQVQVVGHLDAKRAAWFESLDMVKEYSDDGIPMTTMTLEVLDQAMLHGLLTQIRDLGLPLLAVNHIQ
jgi:hypothetical protein